MTRVFFLGGNGHCGERLGPATEVISDGRFTPSIELVSTPYPGFEGRPAPGEWSGFQGEVDRWLRREVRPGD